MTTVSIQYVKQHVMMHVILPHLSPLLKGCLPPQLSSPRLCWGHRDSPGRVPFGLSTPGWRTAATHKQSTDLNYSCTCSVFSIYCSYLVTCI